MERIFLFIASLFGGISVAAGAMGAHLLKSQISVYQMEIFEKGVRYQMYHALALLAVALLLINGRFPKKTLTLAGWFFIGGVLFFSGSLYMLVATGETFFGATTPIGGVAFIIGWILLMLSFSKLKLR